MEDPITSGPSRYMLIPWTDGRKAVHQWLDHSGQMLITNVNSFRKIICSTMDTITQSKQPQTTANLYIHPSSLQQAFIWGTVAILWFDDQPVCLPKAVCTLQNSKATECLYLTQGEPVPLERIPSWCHCVCPAFSANVQSAIEWKHSQSVWPKHPNNSRRCFQCGKEAQHSPDVWPLQEKSDPHLSRDGKK